MRISEDDDESLAGFIWLCFGYESKYDKETFLDKVKDKKCNWLFDGK